jgi:hypothetical protein
MNPVCLFLGHHRSRSLAHQDPTFGWRSVCQRCGKPMVRLGHRNWCLESRAPHRSSATNDAAHDDSGNATIRDRPHRV